MMKLIYHDMRLQCKSFNIEYYTDTTQAVYYGDMIKLYIFRIYK